MTSLTNKEQVILRELGSAYMERATLPVQKEKVRLWKKTNACRMERPMVVIDQLPWEELGLGCQITDRYWRQVEDALLKSIYMWDHFPVDMVLEPFITIPLSIENSGYGLAVQQNTLAQGEPGSISSHQYFNQIQTLEDVQKIQDIKIILDRAESQRHLEEAQVLFQGIAPVKQSHGLMMHLGLWDHLAEYIGVEDVYYDLIDEPELLHAAMTRLTDATLAGIRQLNELAAYNDIANTCHCSYVYTDELLPDFGAGKGSVSHNGWAFGLAQLFTSVSPEVFAEFELPYITKLAKEFGRIYYGCCDRLDDRLDYVKQIPHVKKVSCSPWSDREQFAEKIGKELVMSNKPTPTFLATAQMDEQAVREDLKRTVDLARKNGVNLELILKDISTVQHDPRRLTRWAEIAMEVVESY